MKSKLGILVVVGGLIMFFFYRGWFFRLFGTVLVLSVILIIGVTEGKGWKHK